MKIEPCPACKSKNIRIAHVMNARYFVMCNKCFWCGKTKLFKFRAIRSWNKSELNNTDMPIW